MATCWPVYVFEAGETDAIPDTDCEPCLVLAGNALAEEKPKSVAKELDKSSPILASANADSGSTDESTTEQRGVASAGGGSSSQGGTRAQDYNSSRSNTTALRQDKVGDLDGDGRPDVAVCRNGVDEDCDDTDADVRPANHNTTRSNRTQARDRSPGGDGDSRLREVTCSMASDDCVEYQDGNDIVLRKRPGR